MASCIGIDIGHTNAVVGIARRGGIDILSNEVSKRLTSCFVGFSGKERKLGEAAAAGITSNLKNTITGPKAIVGKKFHSDDVQAEIPLVAYSMKDVAGEVGIPVMYNDEELVLSPEKAMSMLMLAMQKIAQDEQGSPVTDCVLSVPAYFTDSERRAMLDAASIAGLNCLRLMNDSTAAALSYGIYKTDMPADKTTYVAFVDVGAMDSTVSIVAFVKGKLTVHSTACDRHLGGRDFDMLLAKRFAAEWKEKHGIDALTNKKAMYRLLVACEKTKKILSANPQAPINIECFMDDIDVKSMIDRVEFLESCEPALVRLDKLLAEAFEGCGLASKDEIASVEIFGGSVRIPAVQARVSAYFGKECSKTLNFDECVAKGCSLQAAMLSPAFKVRDFQVNDITMYPIALSWTSSANATAPESMEVDGEADAPPTKPGASSTVVFTKFNSMPNTKMLTFYRKETFTLTAAYDPAAPIPNGFPTKISEFTVSNIPPRAPDEEGKVDPARIKVKLRLDVHGVMVLDSAVAIEEQEVIEEVPAAEPPKKPAETAPAAEAGADAAESPAPAEAGATTEGEAAPAAADAAPSEPAPAEAAEPEKKKTKKTKRINLDVAMKSPGITPQGLMEAQEAEAQMALQDRLIAETAEAMNALESSVYSYRDALSMKLADFVSESDKEKLSAMLTTTEDWLYDEGFDAEKSVYQAKLKEVQQAFAPASSRESEAANRPEALAELQKQISRFAAFASDTSEEYAHIKAEDKEKVAAESQKAEEWLAGISAKLEGLAMTAEPPVKVSEVQAKTTALIDTCEPIVKTPKPPPPKPEPAPTAAPEVDAAGAAAPEGAEEAAPAEAATEAAPAAAPDNMDVD